MTQGRTIQEMLDQCVQLAPLAMRTAIASYDSCIQQTPPEDAKAFVLWQQCCRQSLKHISSLVKLVVDIERRTADDEAQSTSPSKQALIAEARRRLQQYLQQGGAQATQEKGEHHEG